MKLLTESSDVTPDDLRSHLIGLALSADDATVVAVVEMVRMAERSKLEVVN